MLKRKKIAIIYVCIVRKFSFWGKNEPYDKKYIWKSFIETVFKNATLLQ